MNHSRSATVRITVKGNLTSEWVEYLGSLATTTESQAAQTTTTLSGEIIDQAALLGVLNNLYGLGFSILSVDYQLENDKEKNYV